MDLDTDSIANLGYLIAAVLFIFGLKGLTHPRTAVRGNQMGPPACCWESSPCSGTRRPSTGPSSWWD